MVERTLWTYGVNDHLTELAPEELKAFKPTGRFRADVRELCHRCGAVPHAAFIPPQGAAVDVAEGATLSVQAMLLDRAALQAARHVLPAAMELRALRFSGCSLDVEAFGLLKGGLADGCTVTTLQIDWNPLEVPPEDLAELRRLGAESRPEEVDALEQRRAARQATRALRELGERLEARWGDVEALLRRVAEAAVPEQPATAMLTPLEQPAFVRAWAEGSQAPLAATEAVRVFGILDGPLYGCGDGLVPLARLRSCLAAAKEATGFEEEDKDPLGLAFAGLLDATSPLEVVSFRYCNIGRVEAQAMGKALGAPSPHLRALNLWGNSVCDRGAAALGKALETNFGLQYLGLGRNLVTHVGLQHLCKALGVTRLAEKAEAEPVNKAIKEQLKEREKRLKNAPPPKRDGSGRERYAPELYVPACEEHKDPETSKSYWLWTRNLVLKTLVLEHNPIADVAAVQRLQPYGCGDLVLRGAPCAEELAALVSQARRVEAASPEGTPPPSSAGHRPPQPFKGIAAAVTGWRLVLT